MAIEVSSCSVVCCKCGKSYGRRKGYFPVSYASQHKGVGYIPVCKECIDLMYNSYLSQCDNARDAVRQMCRKLDLFWSDTVFEVVERKSTTHSMMTSYIAKLNTVTYAGKCYDDTLSAEGTLWNWTAVPIENEPDDIEEKIEDEQDNGDEEVSDEVIEFWGPGFTSKMYQELEQRRVYWTSKISPEVEIDVGTEALIRQICNLEITINRNRAAGRSIDKPIGMLNTLLGSLGLKPSQKRDEDGDAAIDGTPFGVWIKRWEDQRPIPEPDPELQDVDGIIRYILTWFYGHLAKMLNIKNAHSKLYDDAIAELRIERPEYVDEDDETMINDIFATDSSDEES